MPKLWRYILILLTAAVLLVFLATFSLTDSRLHLVFCDVGQGDATLIYRGSTQVLVDGGPDRSVLSCLSNHMPFWDRKIELVVLTHADSDHYGGLVDVVRRYQIGSFVTSGVGKESVGFKTLAEEISMRDIKVLEVQEGDGLKLGSTVLGTVWPSQAWVARAERSEIAGDVLGVATTSESPNEFSIVLGLSYGEFDALLTGDIQPPVTDLVADKVGPSSSAIGETTPRRWEVLKVPHHGSKNGLTQELLDTVQPNLAVISVGEKNRYGHPHKSVLEMLEGFRVVRTDQDGEIEIVTDGRVWEIR